MKTFRRIAALVLVVLTVVSFAGCSVLGALASKENPDKQAVIGSWKADVDISQTLADEVSKEVAEYAEYFDFTGLTLAINLQLNEDDTYSLYIDEASVNDFSEQLHKVFCDGMGDMIDAICAESGVTSEDFLVASGYDTIEEFVDDSFSMTEMTDEFTEMINSEDGCFALKDGMIFTSDSVEVKPSTANPEDGRPYTLDGDTLTLNLEEDDDIPEFMQTLVFKRQ